MEDINKEEIRMFMKMKDKFKAMMNKMKMAFKKMKDRFFK